MDQTLYEELEGALQKHALTYEDIEKITVKYKGKIQILERNEARRLLQRGKLLETHVANEPDNMPFFAYTKDRIFFISHGDEFPDYQINSIPRNPTNKEEPKHLPE